MSTSLVRRRSPLQISLGAHLFVVSLALLTLNGPNWLRVESPNDSMPIEILEQPAPALSPRPMAQKKPVLPDSKKQAVFGASRRTLVSPEVQGGVEVKSGNTLAKEPDSRVLRDEDPDVLPIPTDEYLVSEMPQLESDFRVPYPEGARRERIQGPVIFDLLIDEKGRVREARRVQGPGHGLDEAAESAILKLKFKPARVENKTVAVRIRYAYRFVLEN